MARYCVSTANRDQIYQYYEISSSDYGVIVLIGNISYGISVFINGFLVDILGAKLSMVISCLGSGTASILSGTILKLGNLKGNSFIVNTSIWYLINNYFQTFSTSAIVKFGAAWYHITERGFFSGIFGVVISFGFFLAFQVDGLFIANDKSGNLYLMFIVPGCLLFVMAALNYFIVKAIPEDKFDSDVISTLRPVEEQLPKTENQKKAKFTCGGFWLRIWHILKPLLQVKILYMLAIIEIFLGYIRDGTLNYYSAYFNSQDDTDVQYIIAETGVTIAGMFGSLFTGVISDLCFKSQRQPVAVLDFSFMAIVYSCLTVSIVYDDSYYSQAILVSLASFAFQGVNGILTSTMAMDFANKESTGFCAGFLDAIQKIGSSLTGAIIPAITKDNDWMWWPISFIVVAIIDIILFIPIMNIKASDTQKQQQKIIDQDKKEQEEEPLINQDVQQDQQQEQQQQEQQ